jgi:anti-sigma regulatory factor (Ser/Thr protein kinase)
MSSSAEVSHEEVHRCFQPEPPSARAARCWCEPVLEKWGLVDRQSEAVLVLSELVANAIRHGSGDIDVRLRRTADAVRIEVTDAGSADGVAAQEPDMSSPTGRGLAIVEHFVTAWGVRELPEGGKTVWAALPVHAG